MAETNTESEIEALLADGSVPAGPEELFEKLRALEIAWQAVSHPPLYTVADSKELRGQLAGHHVKNLFLRNKKGGQWLVTCLEDREIDLKSLAAALNAGRISFGSPARLMAALGLRPGAVTPLAVINDLGGQVTLVLDAELTDGQPVWVHPLVNDQTIALKGPDLLRFANELGHPPRLLDFATL
ncbi:MAG: prolyl-tRNA synthetase associated domain-containing protein [Pseudomonadota bacterium]